MSNTLSTISTEWDTVRLGDALTLINGRAFKPTEWSQKGLPIVRIQNLNKPDAPFNYYEGKLPEKFLLNSGDLLFAWSGTPGTSFGAHIWRGKKAWLNQHIFKIVFDEKEFDKRFLQLAINQNLQDYIFQAHGGAGLAHITKGKFEKSELPKPPLDLQKSIVAEIEKQFSRLDEAVANLKRVTANLNRYKAAVINKMTSNTWQKRALGSLLAEPLRNGHSAKSVSTGKGIPTFNLSAVTYGDFSDRNIKITSADKERVRNLWVKNGDIFIERSNTPELVGTARLYSGEDNRAIFPDLLIRVRVNHEAAPRWVEICLQSDRLRKYFKSRAQGISGTMPKIDQQTIMDAEIPLPPVSDQLRLISTVDRYLSLVKETESEVDSNLRRANLLRQSILLKAFTGKLINLSIID